MKAVYFILINLLFINSLSKLEAKTYNDNIDESIVQTCYLSLLGRFPIENEKNKWLSHSKKDLPNLIDALMDTKEFYTYIESKLRYELLEGTTEAALIEDALNYYFLSMTKQSSLNYNYFQRNFENLNFLGSIITQNFPSTVSIMEIQAKLVNNPIYDNINMGASNLVISVFQHFLNRKPTNFELEQSINIIEGKFGVLFNQKGDSKSDFISILFQSASYKEEQIKYWYEYINNAPIGSKNYQIILNNLKDDFSIENVIKQLILMKCQEN